MNARSGIFSKIFSPVLSLFAPLRLRAFAVTSLFAFGFVVLFFFSTSSSAYGQGPIRRAIRERVQNRPAPKPSDEIEKRTIQVGDTERAYWIHIPPSHEVTPGMPLVIVLHGGGGSGPQAERSYGWTPKSDREGFIVVYPDGTGPAKDKLLTWNAGACCGQAMDQKVDDVAFIRALVAHLLATYKINPKKVYATGLSNGGMMSYRLGCEASDIFAAIGPVAGALNCETCTPQKPVSVVAVHGKKDQNVKFEGGSPERKFDNHPRTDKSVAESTGFWIKHNGCAEAPKTESREGVTISTHEGGRDKTAVKIYAITEGGHSWPGGLRGSRLLDETSKAINATDEIWEFFKSHPKP